MINLLEIEVQDSQGNVVIAPDLKVRHKKSQYEYTVDSVIKDEQGQNVVLLRMPEEPRIEPEDTDLAPSLMRDLAGQAVLYEVDPDTAVYEPEIEDPAQDLLAVPSDEFEKEYEVK